MSTPEPILKTLECEDPKDPFCPTHEVIFPDRWRVTRCMDWLLTAIKKNKIVDIIPMTWRLTPEHFKAFYNQADERRRWDLQQMIPKFRDVIFTFGQDEDPKESVLSGVSDGKPRHWVNVRMVMRGDK